MSYPNVSTMRCRDKSKVKKWKRQRAHRGWADCDVWGIDEFLMNILPEMMEKLAEDGCSYPVRMNSLEEWQAWLRQTAAMWREMKRIFDEFCIDTDQEEFKKLKKECFERLESYFFDLWD